MLYSQPLSTRFGTDLIGHISSGAWTQIDIAVAWVRESGMRHIGPCLQGHLKVHGQLRVVVGIDLDNTTVEGLESLLSLKASGNARIFVNHNESDPIFHPKLYLFRNLASDRAKLIVGSNNITEAGLYRNTEAGLAINSAATGPLIVSAISAIDSWCDPSLGLARELTASLLVELENEGYIAREASVRAAASARRSASRKKGSKRLFASVAVSSPPMPAGAASSAAATTTLVPAKKSATSGAKKPSAAATPASTGVTTAGAVGQVLLMRVRKAHKTNRPTQTQIPKDVAESAFFKGISAVLSVHSGQTHGVRPAKARGIVNTLKLEIPEMRTMNDPIVRFEHSAAGVQYEVYEGSSPQGASLWASLRAGRTTSPVSTYLTKPATPGSSTWWRFI